MVYETPDTMSAGKKQSLRRSMKSAFGRKSSKNNVTKLTPPDSSRGDDDSAVMASPTPEVEPADVDQSHTQRRGSKEQGKDTKSQFIISRGTSGKSYKWPFRNRRSEDNGNMKTDVVKANTSLSSDHEPGSGLDNNHGLDVEGETDSASAHGCDAQRKGPAEDVGLKHQFFTHRKGEGYVIALHRQQPNAMHKHSDDSCDYPGPSEHLQEVNLNVVLDGTNSKEGQNEWDGSHRDKNGNPSCSVSTTNNTEAFQNEEKDTLQQIGTHRPPPQLPPPCQDSEPELPPRIPPKPASLKNRSLCAADPFASLSDLSDDLSDGEAPPRPPARPKIRTLGSLLLNSKQWDNPRDNRATVYETISLEPKEASLAKELAKLPRQPWYWGPLTQAQAEEKLAKLPDGNFLVRDSSDDRYLLSLSFNSHGRTLHSRIEHRNNLFSLNDSDGHSSVVELIECAVQESRRGVYGYMRDPLGVQSFPARLTDWVSRFTEMRSLQHLCRFLIREVYARHHIQMLPLPKKVKEYILENQY